MSPLIARDCKPKPSAVGHGAQQGNRVDEWVVKLYFFKALKYKIQKTQVTILQNVSEHSQ